MNNYPISIINHNSIITKNSPNGRYREHFNTVILPKGNKYKITSITCKIDTTSLWNIRKINTVLLCEQNGNIKTYTVPGGYYTINDLCKTIDNSITINNENRAVVGTKYKYVEVKDADDLENKFKLHDKENSGTIATDPYDIMNSQNVIRIYSSIMSQTFGIKSSFIDNLIHVSIGLNNIITLDNLNIDVIDQSNLDYIDWQITDMDDKPISLITNIYISFTISCY